MQKARFSDALRPLYDKRFARRLPHRTAAPKRDTAVPYRKTDKAAVARPYMAVFSSDTTVKNAVCFAGNMNFLMYPQLSAWATSFAWRKNHAALCTVYPLSGAALDFKGAKG